MGDYLVLFNIRAVNGAICLTRLVFPFGVRDCHVDWHGLLQVKKEELKEKQLLEQYKKY